MFDKPERFRFREQRYDRMNCPNCATAYVCPCKNCADTFSKGRIVWIRHEDDTESCPTCGLRHHYDTWQDIEFEQFNALKEKVNQ